MSNRPVKFRPLVLGLGLSALVLLLACTQSAPSTQPNVHPAATRAAQPTATSWQATSLQTLEGRVVGVADGDTITVLGASNRQARVRLQGIDAPESRQAFGEVSKRNLSDLVFNTQVVVEYEKTDRYGRTLGKVLAGGRDVNLEQLKAGWLGTTSITRMSSRRLTDCSTRTRRRKRGRRGVGYGPTPAPSRRGTLDAASVLRSKRVGRQKVVSRSPPPRHQGDRREGRRKGRQSRKKKRSTSPASGRSITARVVNTSAAAEYRSL